MKRSVAHVLTVLTSFVLGCSNQDNSKEMHNKILFEQPVSVNFETSKWSFFLGYEEMAKEPIIIYMKLYAKKGRLIEKILKPCDINKLDGIKIENSDEAIWFLRLFTNENFFPIFDEPRAIELQPESIKIVNQENGFLVIRKLIMALPEKPKGYPVFEFHEEITFDGKYRFVSKKLLDYVPFDKYPFPIIL
jgi:hypothetical protein